MSDPFQTHGAFSWSELRTSDVDKAKAFFTDVIGWTIEEMDMMAFTYNVLKVGDTPVGGIMPKTPEMGDIPDHWMGYITVDDIDDRIAKAEKAGGTVVMPVMDVPNVGRMATVLDPCGAAVSMITYAPREG